MITYILLALAVLVLVITLISDAIRASGANRLTVHYRRRVPFVLTSEDTGMLQDLGEAMLNERGVTGYTIDYADGSHRSVRQ